MGLNVKGVDASERFLDAFARNNRSGRKNVKLLEAHLLMFLMMKHIKFKM